MRQYKSIQDLHDKLTGKDIEISYLKRSLKHKEEESNHLRTQNEEYFKIVVGTKAKREEQTNFSEALKNEEKVYTDPPFSDVYKFKIYVSTQLTYSIVRIKQLLQSVLMQYFVKIKMLL